jgi:hypothetical protein
MKIIRWVDAWRAAFEAVFGVVTHANDRSDRVCMLRGLEDIARSVDYVAPERRRQDCILPAMSVYHGYGGDVGRVALTLAKAIEADEEDRKVRLMVGGAK